MDVWLYLLFVPLLLFLFLGCFHFYVDFKTKLVRLENERTRFKPDSLGNYEVYYDPKTDNFSRFQPGNTRFPEQTYIINPARENSKLATSRPIEINKTEYKITEVPINDNDNDKQSEPDNDDLYNRLLQAKREGRGKVASIKAICGVVAGGTSDTYKTISKVWDSL
jgi:hypothetical protein